MSGDSHHTHWCDGLARAVTRRARAGATVTCAAGISPSGTVHIGNFREIITVDLVTRALQDAGTSVRFLYFWDDYDALRAIPKTISTAEWKQHLRKPLSEAPDPHGSEQSYARHNERLIEEVLPTMGIKPSYIYQHQQYREHRYADMIRVALRERATIRAILNAHRSTPLEEDWWPITIYSSFTGKDTTTVVEWDGEWRVEYRCDETEKKEWIDLRTTGNAKLRWRVDWPMRWAYSGVDFEPAGKDHHTDGGSYETAAEIARQVFGISPPVSVQYDFVRIKGGGGKMSSSTGESLSVNEVLRVYQPEVLRYLFVSTRPNAEFAISFDMDVVKIYEDYDKCERIACGEEEVSERRRGREERIYQLSQTRPTKQATMQGQIPFRHLCSVLQMHEGDVERALSSFPQYADMDTAAQERARKRARCAWCWIDQHAPADFRFTMTDPDAPLRHLTDAQEAAFRQVAALIPDHLESYGEKELHNALYQIATNSDGELSFQELCQLIYKTMIAREEGPRLASFMLLIGKERLLRYFNTERIEA